MYWHHPGWTAALIALNMLWFWGLVIAGIVLLVRYAGKGTPTGGMRDTTRPEQILAQRFASGDIDEDEYQRRLAVLRGGGGPASGSTRAGH